MSRRTAGAQMLRAIAFVSAAAAFAATPTPYPADFKPTAPFLLSAESPTKDEDPSVLRTRAGMMIVAWFSDRGGNPDIYLRSTANGLSWSETVQVTDSPDGDFYPNLFEDAQGLVHLVWFRWHALEQGHIWHSTSADGLTWSEANEEQVTDDDAVDDWIPTLSELPDGTLLIFFVSRLRSGNGSYDLFVTIKPAGESEWEPPVPLATLSSPTDHEQLPVAAWTGDRLTLIWVRSDNAHPIPWKSGASELFFASSTDGRNWSSAVQLTRSRRDAVNLFPALYQRPDSRWFVTWLSNRSGPLRVLELPLANATRFPKGLTKNKRMRIGYSHHVAATPRPGIYLGAWVEGLEGEQEIFARFFRR